VQPFLQSDLFLDPPLVLATSLVTFPFVTLKRTSTTYSFLTHIQPNISSNSPSMFGIRATVRASNAKRILPLQTLQLPSKPVCRQQPCTYISEYRKILDKRMMNPARSTAKFQASTPPASSRFYVAPVSSNSAKPKFSLLEWKRSTMERLTQKKAQVLVEYGSTFVFLHEVLGIASYLACFGIAHMGLVNMDDIISFIPALPDHIKEYISLKKDGLATTAVTALVLLKCLDWMGLTPFRWFLAITLTPRIAWWVGPKVDAVTNAVKSFLPGSTRSTTPPVASPSNQDNAPKPIQNVEEKSPKSEQPTERSR